MSKEKIDKALLEAFPPSLHAKWMGRFLSHAVMMLGLDPVSEGRHVSFDVEGPETFAAALPWGLYRVTFRLQPGDVAALRSRDVDAIRTALGERVVTALCRLPARLNRDAIRGTAVDEWGTPSIIGLLGGALASSGIYACVDRDVMGEWRGNEIEAASLLQARTLVDRSTFSRTGATPGAWLVSRDLRVEAGSLAKAGKVEVDPYLPDRTAIALDLSVTSLAALSTDKGGAPASARPIDLPVRIEVVPGDDEDPRPRIAASTSAQLAIRRPASCAIVRIMNGAP